MINGSGPGADHDRSRKPLIRRLLHERVVRLDPLWLGLDVMDKCALLNRPVAISHRLFAVGPVTKDAFREMTAVPGIRWQAKKLAEYLADLGRGRIVWMAGAIFSPEPHLSRRPGDGGAFDSGMATL